jgi:hypothetical protein
MNIFDKPERIEAVNIKMKLTGAAAKSHKDAVLTLNPTALDHIRDDDDLLINYSFIIQYFDDVLGGLEAVQEICEDPDVVLSASCAELEEGRLLVYEVLKKLEAVIKTTKARE